MRHCTVTFRWSVQDNIQGVPKLFVQINTGGGEHQNKYISLLYIWGRRVIGIFGSMIWWKTLMELVNFGEVRKAQLGKSTLLTSSLVPLGSFQIFYGFFGCYRESGVRKVTESYRTYSSLVKLQPSSWVCTGKPAFGQNCILGAWNCSEGPALGQNTDDGDDDGTLVLTEISDARDDLHRR